MKKIIKLLIILFICINTYSQDRVTFLGLRPDTKTIREYDFYTDTIENKRTKPS